MQPSKFRTERFNQLILREIVQILRTKTKDPRLQNIEITEVITSKDLSSAKVFFSCEADMMLEVMTSLQKAQGFIRHELAHSVELRHTPTLNFKFDDTSQKVMAIENILNALKK